MNSNTWDTDSRGRTGILVLARGSARDRSGRRPQRGDRCAGATDLALTKSDSADPVTEGGNFVYTIQAANTGANDATDDSVTHDVLPNQVVRLRPRRAGAARGSRARHAAWERWMRASPRR